MTQRPITEIPGLRWTESIDPRFANKTPGDLISKISKLGSLSYWQVRMQDKKVAGYMHSVLDEISQDGVDEFVQIGAHNGSFDDPFTSYIPRFKHSVLVEPQEKQFQELLAKYSDSPNVSLRRAAIAAHSGELTLFRANVPGEAEFSSAIASKNETQVRSEVARCLGTNALAVASLETETVTAITMAELLSAELDDPSKLTVLASDTEGSDAVVVKGALAEVGVRPPVIVYEHLHVSSAENKEVAYELKSLGYRLASTHKDTIAVL